MMEFAVTVEGLDREDQARWVLEVDAVGERFLIAHDDRTLHWHPMAECTFAKCANPDQPRLVLPVQPQQSPQALTVPRVKLGDGKGPLKLDG